METHQEQVEKTVKLWDKLDRKLPHQCAFGKEYLLNKAVTPLEEPLVRDLIKYPKEAKRPRKSPRGFAHKDLQMDCLKKCHENPLGFVALFLKVAPKRRKELLKHQEDFTIDFKKHVESSSQESEAMRKEIDHMFKLLEILKEEEETWKTQETREELVSLIQRAESAISPNSSMSTKIRNGSVALIKFQQRIYKKTKELEILSKLFFPIISGNSIGSKRIIERFLNESSQPSKSAEEVWNIL